MKKLLAFLLLSTTLASADMGTFTRVEKHLFGVVNLDTSTVKAIPGFFVNQSSQPLVVNFAVDDTTSTVYFSTANVAGWTNANGFPVKKDGAISINTNPLGGSWTTFYFIRKETDAGWPGTIPVRWWLELGR